MGDQVAQRVDCGVPASLANHMTSPPPKKKNSHKPLDGAPSASLAPRLPEAGSLKTNGVSLIGSKAKQMETLFMNFINNENKNEKKCTTKYRPKMPVIGCVLYIMIYIKWATIGIKAFQNYIKSTIFGRFPLTFFVVLGIKIHNQTRGKKTGQNTSISTEGNLLQKKVQKLTFDAQEHQRKSKIFLGKNIVGITAQSLKRFFPSWWTKAIKPKAVKPKLWNKQRSWYRDHGGQKQIEIDLYMLCEKKQGI